jgi:predicted alpha/beta-fold hydrolase
MQSGPTKLQLRLRPFHPLLKNAHLATLVANYWPRPSSERDYPIEAVEYQTEPDVRVLVHTQRPHGEPCGELVLVHGLEGSSESGYARSMAAAALAQGYIVHRFNMRSCGGTESLAATNYHSGQTSDLLHVLQERRRASRLPLFVTGYSLGGNVALKLAGELGEQASDLLAGVCAVSAPIDLAECARALGRPVNFLYEKRFLQRLCARVRLRHRQAPHIYSLEGLKRVRSIWDFDDVYTGPLFGFGSAVNYYRTQSSNQYLAKIRVPTLLMQAKDDPLIPFSVYDRPEFRDNPSLRLVALEHGGHLGFLARQAPRLWLDGAILEWVETTRKTTRNTTRTETVNK